MNLRWRQLEAFRLFARTQNVTETARLLHISQPAVSQMLKEVEEQVGFPLFNRSAGRTRLTSEALSLLPDVERLMAQMASLRGRAAELRDTQSGSLSIASVPTLFAELLPVALSTFRAEHDKVRLRVESYTASEVVRQIRQDTADVGFAFLPVDEIGVAVQPIMQMRVVCAMAKGHPLAGRTVVTPRDLDHELVIVQGAQTPPGMVLHESLQGEAAGMRLLDTNQSIPALHMVRHGIGVALVHPLTLSQDVAGELVPVPFEPEITLTLGMIYSRQRAVPRVVIRFEKHLRASLHAFCADMTARGLVCEALI
ncbi:MAG: LysR family transcriptional regulator [Rhodocyclaceae bacterium]